MAITVDWATKVIDVPISDLTLVSGTLYTLDTNWFKNQLRAQEASVYGMANVRIVDHITTYTVAGVEYARKVEIVNGYVVRFEEESYQYSVRLEGSNNNIFDIENGILFQNNVQVIPTNSAGLVVTGGGSAPTVSEITADIDANSTQLAAIKERTDNLPDSPAAVSDIPTATENADATWNKTLP